MKITKEQQNKMQKASRREWFLKNNIPVKKEQTHKDKTRYNRRKNKKIEMD
jgi:hypothetical protein